jgi:hypothetical protein
MVVALLPNASKKAKGKSAATKGCSASAEMACSMSTAFMVRFYTVALFDRLNKNTGLTLLHLRANIH